MNKAEVLAMDWYQILQTEVQNEYKRLVENQQAQAPVTEREKTDLERQIQGWSLSLANPELDPQLRNKLESQYAAALRRIAEIEAAIVSRSAEQNRIRAVVDPQAVSERLSRLADVLAGTNPSLGNIELAHHIDVIRCYDDGKVVVRSCRLGALADAVDLFSVNAPSCSESGPDDTGIKNTTARPRRLARRRTESGAGAEPLDSLKARAIWATDPNRFAELDEHWFEELTLQVPKKISWTEQYAPCVATCRKLGFTEAQLAAHFKKSMPTIRKALRIAKAGDAALCSLPRRMPRRRWHEDNALEVARLSATGMGTGALVRHFGKSDVTIRKAIEYARSTTAHEGKAAP